MATYYVSTVGNDSWDGLAPAYVSGTNGPWLTMVYAATKVAAGDTVEIRGGTYQAYGGTWVTSGTETNPITITNYADETVIIDGNNFTIPSSATEGLVKIYGEWYTVSNLEISYSGGVAVIVAGSASHCTLDNIYAHHCWGGGIVFSGWYGLVDNCRAYYNSMDNENWGAASWGFGISACRYPQYTTIRGCTAWDNWGEGISTFETEHITIEDCVSYNNGQNFYLSDTKYTLLQRSLSYFTANNQSQAGTTQQCIFLGDEKGGAYASTNNTVINNFCLGGERNIAVGALPNYLIAHNTFVNASDTQGTDEYNVLFYTGTHTGGKFQNNVILEEDADIPIALNGGTGVTLGYNCWSKAAPVNCQGTGDVVDNPDLAKTGSTAAGELTGEYFQILTTSPAKDAGTDVGIDEDYWQTGRPFGTGYDIGAHEWTGDSLWVSPGSYSLTGSTLTIDFFPSPRLLWCESGGFYWGGESVLLARNIPGKIKLRHSKRA